MHVIEVDNVNQALARGLEWLQATGVTENSRNGKVIVSPCPVTTVYRKPWQRVLFSPLRDANPFFHLMEALWMLAGRNDLEWPLYFNSKFGAFSDDNVTVHGAYGHRWRKWFGFDQLQMLIAELKHNPETRRAVLTMWDGREDLHQSLTAFNQTPSKDVPCNTHIYFDVRNGLLNMTVCCRSNDILWGAYGANAVHMSLLQEYVAASVGVEMGVYRQVSNNYHIYPDALHCTLQELADDAWHNDHYYILGGTPRPKHFPLVRTGRVGEWDVDLFNFMADPLRSKTDFLSPFFAAVAAPMYRAFHRRKAKIFGGCDDPHSATSVLTIEADDWRWACTQWIVRREHRKQDVPEQRPTQEDTK